MCITVYDILKNEYIYIELSLNIFLKHVFGIYLSFVTEGNFKVLSIKILQKMTYQI